MSDEGLAAADAVIDALDEPRRSQMRHLHEVILAALPGIDVTIYQYSGTLIGYGSYDYSNSKGPAGRWFTVGLANRKAYIALYAMGTIGDGHLVEARHDRFPGTKIGRSCIQVRRPETIDDNAVRDLAREAWSQFKDQAST